MPSRTLPNLALDAFFDLGEDGWADEVSLNFLKLSVLTQAGAIDKVSATPGSPTSGDVYIFDESHPTEANKIAVYDVDTWKYFTPLEGWLIYNRTANYFELFSGTAWAEFAAGGGGGGSGDVVLPYAVPFGFTAKPGDAEVMLLTVFAENVTFLEDFDGAESYVGTNPTATATLTVRKNGTTAGTISISSAGVVTFATTASEPLSFVAGDVLQIDAQATADATLANCAFTLLGVRD